MQSHRSGNGPVRVRAEEGRLGGAQDAQEGRLVPCRRGRVLHAVGPRRLFTSLDANGKDRIVIETALSVEPLHYLVTPTDELEKVQLFDEPRRRGEAAKYAKTIVDDINKSANMCLVIL